jgi:hypothetical protein
MTEQQLVEGEVVVMTAIPQRIGDTMLAHKDTPISRDVEGIPTDVTERGQKSDTKGGWKAFERSRPDAGGELTITEKWKTNLNCGNAGRSRRY